ncbi:unnamed protein product [Hymenolepis diminuta]|uniref:Integrase catalytic domain-containing protein n=1 Tax=Hymenolepis diminuta TaxID=6216 RepID=A0A564Z9Y7_HYMDI|nr:unnamed protein product [Hymenolepis diminuta]
MDSIETAKIAAIVRCIMEQMNLSKPDKDQEDYIKNVGEFHYEPVVGETFTTWYARNRGIYENRMARLFNETRINMLLKLSKSDHNLCLAYLLPLSPKDFTFEGTIEKCEKVFGHNISLFNRRFKCLNLTISEGEDIHNGRHIELQVDTGSDITIVSAEAWKSLGLPKLDKAPFKASSASGDAVQLSGATKCEATFKGKSVATVCYVADQDINSSKEEYRRTEDLGQVDGLSRLIENQRAENEEAVIESVSFERDVQHILAESIGNTPISAEWNTKGNGERCCLTIGGKEPHSPRSCTMSTNGNPVNQIIFVVDSYSKWPEVVPLTVVTSGTTIGALDRIFSTHGLPKTLVSGNGTQFTPADFKEFCEQQSIVHIRIPQYHPQSNGQTERSVDTLKRGLKKRKEREL